MSVVLCLPAHLRVSTAASRGRPPTGTRHWCVVLLVRCRGPLGSCSPLCPLGVLCCVAVSWTTWLLFAAVPARYVVLRVRCPGPLGSCSLVHSPVVLCGVLGLLAPVHRCARSVSFAVGCVCGPSLRGAHSSIRTVALRSRQGLGTLRARTRPSGRRLFVAGRGWVPSGRTRVHPDGGCSVDGRGWVRCRARTRPYGRGLVLLSTCSRAVVRCALCALSGFAAPGSCRLLAPVRVPWLWPAACLSGVPRGPAWCAAPRPVLSLSVLWSAFPTPWCLSPPGGLRPRLYWVAARGTRRPAKNWAHCACRWPPPRQGRWARSASYRFGAPRWGCPWRVPPASVLGCVRCGGWRVLTRSLTRPVSRTVRRSTGDWAGAQGLFRVDADTSHCGSEDATPGSRACVRVLALLGRVGRAGLPGAFWCASPFPLAALSFFFAWPPPGWHCPCLGPLFALPSPLLLFFFVSPLLSSLRPLCLLLSLVSGPWCPGPWRCVSFVLLASRFLALRALSPPLCVPPGRWLLPGGCCAPPPPPPFLCLAVSVAPLRAPFFFFPALCAPVVSGSLWFPAPGALGLGAVRCLLCWPPASWLSVRFCLFPAFRLAVGCSLVVAAPPPLFCVSLFPSLRSVLLSSSFFSSFFLRCAPPLSLASSGFRPRLPWASALCVVCLAGLPLLSSPCALASFVLSAWPLAAPWWLLPPPPPLCLAVFVAAARCCVPCAVLCCVSLGAVLRRAAARCAARCCAVVCCVALLRSFGTAACSAVPSGAARRPGALCSAALCFAVFPRAVCSVLCVF